jgi:hypothetical protein
MTLPYERTRAIRNTREFLRALLDPKKTPGVPKWIRKEAYYRLKHFPNEFDMEQLLEGRTEYEVFGKEEKG